MVLANLDRSLDMATVTTALLGAPAYSIRVSKPHQRIGVIDSITIDWALRINCLQALGFNAYDCYNHPAEE